MKAGDKVEEGQRVLIVEAMKMEIPVSSTCAGTVAALHVSEGQSLPPGQTLLTVHA